MDKIIAGRLIVYLLVSLNRKKSIVKIGFFFVLTFSEYKFNAYVNCFTLKKNLKEFVNAEKLLHTVILLYIAFFISKNIKDWRNVFIETLYL